MTENKNMVVNQTTPPEDGKKKFNGAKFKANLKEWWRKQIVSLKRRPSRIAFVFVIVTSLIYILSLASFSQAIMGCMLVTDWPGICCFGSTLLSILIFVAYMNSFPKRKKPNVLMIVLVGLFLALMLFFDLMFYIEVSEYMGNQASVEDYYYTTTTTLIVHMIFIGITAVVMATMPLYKKLILRINTRKEVETTQMKEVIDTTDMD